MKYTPKNILFVTPRLPYPADTGAKIRTFNLLKAVSRENQVSLLSFCFEKNGKAEDEFKALRIDLYLVKAKESFKPQKIFGALPLSIEKYLSEEMKNELKRLLTITEFDLVHFDHLHMGQYRDCIDGLPCVLDEHNVESVILNRCAEIEKNPIKRTLFMFQAKKMASFEAGLVNNFSKCLVVSESDKQKLYELSGRKANIEVITNGVDIEYFSQTFRDSPLRGQSFSSDEEALVFTGSMDWLPNSDAVLYFCKTILPLIWEKNDKVKFYIVGKNPTNDVKSLGIKDQRIIVTGQVPDVRPYMARAKIFVVPMRIGGGTRLKILEAMSMGKAVVSTSIGAEGIDCTDGINIMLKDSPGDFAESVLILLEDDHRKESLGKSGRELVCQNYDWRIIGERLSQIYREVVKNGRQR